MKRIFKQKSQLVALLFVGLLVGCSSDDTAVFENLDPDPNPDPVTLESTIIFNEEDPSLNKTTATAMGEAGERVPGNISFTTSGKSQKRLYVTQNIAGQGDMPFNDFFDFDADDLGVDLKKLLKGDGSIDIDGTTKSSINFTFNLPVPNSVDDGAIVYSFWTTTGKGDFRNSEKRKKLGVGTITVTVGTGNNPAAEVRSFNGVKLNAPDEFGNTKTFFSLLDGKEYIITDGPEFRFFWDFGYYYTDNQASLASTSAYKANFPFDVEGFEVSATEDDAANETLNKTYFILLNPGDFDTVSMSGELDALIASTPDSQNISDLDVDDVVGFVDNYGNKGVLKVTALQRGFGNDDFIQFDIKVQP